MDREQLAELHYITPHTNLSSILEHGILSHSRANSVVHSSVAMAEIQDRRAQVTVPGGLKLHDYANLYFTARNPMLYKRRSIHASLAVLRISTDALDIQGVVITDGNAAGDYVAFLPSPSGLAYLDHGLVFARYWNDPDEVTYWRKKTRKCSEVLVPHALPASYILGAYVSCHESAQIARTTATSLSIEVNQDLFFI